MSRKSGALTYPEPLGPPWPVVGDLYLYHIVRVHEFSIVAADVGGSDSEAFYNYPS